MKIAAGIGQAIGMIGALRPDAVIVMGGYLSFAPALAARLYRIPVILHEQNAVPGLANKLVARFATRIAVSFPESRAAFGAGAVLTGNPVRTEFRALPERDGALRRWNLDPAKKTVLIFGGSLGAQRLNTFVAGAFARLGAHARTWQVLHFTGPADLERVKKLYDDTAFTHHVDGYCHEMPTAYAAADLVVSRAGASTLAELIAVKKPAVLVPYPLATGDHQTKNAVLLAEAGAALLREQAMLSSDEMAAVLEGLFAAGSPSLARMAESYRRIDVDPFTASGKIYDLVMSAVRGGQPAK
jgi:UDP-N-acetylglucosamine--N-acetylmuramyl-(pentapeptide) pyrophosphoryl-undecaprenol N-acetylglucosamine transferase